MSSRAHDPQSDTCEEPVILVIRPSKARSGGRLTCLEYLDGEREQMTGLSTLGTLLHASVRSYLLDDLPVKVDRCTMVNSLETRSPFLDMELTEYVVGLLTCRIR